MHTSYSQLKRAAVLGGILIGTFAFSALADWSNPTAAPTGGNAPAPLNVSSNWQSKAGALSIGNATNNSATSNLFVTGGALFDGVSTKTLNVGGTGSSVAGQVLTAADANGNVAWGSPTGQKVTYYDWDGKADGTYTLGTFTYCAMAADTESHNTNGDRHQVLYPTNGSAATPTTWALYLSGGNHDDVRFICIN